MSKHAIPKTRDKNQIIANIVGALIRQQGFLLLGHRDPDDDCIASQVAFALLARKFAKPVSIYVGARVHEHFQYLLDICRYNGIPVLHPTDILVTPVDTIVLCDTPKPAMIAANEEVQGLLHTRRLLRIEIDHHLGADSAYFGDPGYRLVTEASSASELVGQILLWLRRRPALLAQFNIQDLVSRNIVLAVVTGIIGDSRMGMLLKSEREKRSYRTFSTLFNNLLARKTVGESNFSDMKQVYQEIQKQSESEARCLEFFLQHQRLEGRVGYAFMGDRDSARLARDFDRDTVIAAARSVADRLAEESGWLGLVGYCEPPGDGQLVQFRLRRSRRYKSFDLRQVLELFGFKDGGGHEGAIGFRLPRQDIPVLGDFVAKLVQGIDEASQRP
jgi:nanoRNase/pAp phosphatase (c-di-AMP/oligoRNAs hydrolase)